MSRYHKKHCCKPCCPKPIICCTPRPRISRALVAGVLLFLVGRNLGATSPNTNTNVININSEDEYDDYCDCYCESKNHC